MLENDKTMAVAREWTLKAENDLKTASYILKMGKDCPTDTVCFHAQQCVEKYLKALLIARELEFPKTHELGELIALLPARVRPQLDDSMPVDKGEDCCSWFAASSCWSRPARRMVRQTSFFPAWPWA